ncbi:MAG: TlpA family protein disulfide reductase [Gemmatimonadales bacterium]|nr:MAG: TlpA family protein disulfide reductase [Gemmatimonadales bacterium]
MLLTTLGLLVAVGGDSLDGPWRSVLDLAGGELRFSLMIEAGTARLCNGPACENFSGLRWEGDSLVLELADYAASITAVQRGDSLTGFYRNLGRRGPRTIPFRADRGRWTMQNRSPALLGRWDAWFESGFSSSPRILEIRAGTDGVEGAVLSNSGDAGLFWGDAVGDSIAIAHFDGSFVYLLTARLDGDTLRGEFHAGLRSRTPFVATRSTGKPHLTPPTAITRADTTPFRFSFPDLDGHQVASTDQRFQGKVVLLDIFGTWCPTCHEAASTLVQLYRDNRDRGLEVVGVAFEATGDTAHDAGLVRRYREKHGIEFPLLLGGISEQEVVSAALPQLDGFTAFPTTIFIGRDGRVRRIHAGFFGPATGAQYTALVAEYRREVELLLAESGP